MKRNAVDALLQVAFLERVITTRGAYERSVLRKKPRVIVPDGACNALEGRLFAAFGQADAPLTVGGFLKSVRNGQDIRAQELFSRLGLTQNVYRMIEHDRISPLKVPVDVWKKFAELFALPADRLVEMIQRTHRLVFFRPSLQLTLARYDARKNRATKKETMQRAAEELYLRADLPLPADEQKKLDHLVEAVRHAG